MPEKKRYKVSYPYNKEVYELLPNEEIAKTRNIQLEQTLKKNKDDLESANKILKDSFDRGVFSSKRRSPTPASSTEKAVRVLRMSPPPHDC